MYIYPYAVKRGDEVVYTYMPSKQYAGSPPVKRLAAWEGHWILETVEGTFPVSYDRVPHYWCCEPATFNVQSNEHMLWFYALKDGIWHYVEIGIYDE